MIKNKREEILNIFNKKTKYLKFVGKGLYKKMLRGFYSPFKNPFKNPIKYIGYVFWTINHKINLISPKNKKVKLFWGKEINLDLDNKDSLTINVLGFLAMYEEWPLIKFFIKNIKDDDVFYDIGAHMGFYSHLALEFSNEIHTFEPQPEIFSSLRKQFVGENKIKLNNLALSDKAGYIDFFRSLNASVLGTINPQSMEHQNINWDKIKVDADTIDAYILENKKSTILKIDVEGAEEMVIRGGENFFRESSPTVVLEVWPEKNGGDISMKAVELLRKLGYSSYKIDFDGNLRLVSGDLSKSMTSGFFFENFVFKK